MKMRHDFAAFKTLMSSVGATSTAPDNTKSSDASEPELVDVIDQMHDLAKLGHTPWTISEATGVPYISVEYWYHANGYHSD